MQKQQDTKKDQKQHKCKMSKKNHLKHNLLRKRITEREDNQEKDIIQQDQQLQQTKLLSESFIPVEGIEEEQQCDKYMEDQSQQMTSKEIYNHIPLNSESVYCESQFQSKGLLISQFTRQNDYIEQSIPIETEYDDGEVLIQPLQIDIQQEEQEQVQQVQQKDKHQSHKLKKLLKKLNRKHKKKQQK